MRDTELYRQLLGLEKPWTVDRVELDVAKQRVDVFAKHDKPKSWPCPECGTSEVKMGALGKTRFVATIEPWHGNQVVVYTPLGKAWKRDVIETGMVNGHALAVGDLDGDLRR